MKDKEESLEYKVSLSKPLSIVRKCQRITLLGMYAIRVAPSAHLINYERVSSVAGRTLAAKRRSKMSVRTNPNNWLVISVFLPFYWR